ncbi:hypothetical protein FGD77_17760 [Roseovarius sp. M141]|nr:hypothetical protein [Roseovarius sp. M141]
MAQPDGSACGTPVGQDSRQNREMIQPADHFRKDPKGGAPDCQIDQEDGYFDLGILNLAIGSALAV